jgi:hypothetical protein
MTSISFSLKARLLNVRYINRIEDGSIRTYAVLFAARR